MEDEEIVKLYLNRDANAVYETALKYDGYCRAIAKNLLGSDEDAEECVNDAYLNAWNSIPPHRPRVLSAYLGKLTRNLAINRFRSRRADKRGGGQLAQVLEELEECVSGSGSVEEEIDRRELVKAIGDFLNTLSGKKSSLFLCRYWYAYPVSEIAEKFGMTETNVSVTLSRIRKKLKTYLKERSFEL